MTTTTSATTTTDPPPTRRGAPAEDVIDRLLGVEPGSRLDAVRSARPEARANAQRSHDALFAPVDTSDVSLAERYAVAVFVADLHRAGAVTEHYRAGLARHDADGALAAAVTNEVTRGLAAGPYGQYRESGLAGESTPGPRYRVLDPAAVGERLSAALEHAHLLVYRPREASPEALDRLLAAGWSTTGIVTLAQLVSFLAFQVRVVHGLAQLALVPPTTAPEGAHR
ncbi:CMD domain protein [Georgenia wangjunii]|uniref:CMD domain protein n=1 Tax=Georgenia wangjunii TaxID=3117730 RepID=UPI002F25F026